MANRSQVEFGAKVPADLYREFRSTFPVYGATTWFINESLKEFMKQVRKNPDMQQRVVASIESMLDDRKAAIDETPDNQSTD